jgi:hypothetical protein
LQSAPNHLPPSTPPIIRCDLIRNIL